MCLSLLVQRRIPSNLFQLVAVLGHLQEDCGGVTTFVQIGQYMDKAVGTVKNLITQLKRLGWLRIEESATSARKMKFQILIDRIPLRESEAPAPKGKTTKTASPKARRSRKVGQKRSGPMEYAPPPAPSIHFEIQQSEVSPALIVPEATAVVRSQHSTIAPPDLGYENEAKSSFGIFPGLLDRSVPPGASTSPPENPTPANYRAYYYPQANLPWLAHYGLDHLIEGRCSRMPLPWKEEVIIGATALMAGQKQGSPPPMRGEVVLHLVRRVEELAGHYFGNGNQPYLRAQLWLSTAFERGVEIKAKAEKKAQTEFIDSDSLTAQEELIVSAYHRQKAEGQPIPPSWRPTLKKAGIEPDPSELLNPVLFHQQKQQATA